MMKNKVCIANITVMILITAFFAWFLSNDIFLGDDISEIINSVQNTAKYNIDGLFTSFLTKLFCINIPLLFHIHPHQFSMTVGAFVRAFDIALVCGIISLFLFIGREKKYYILLGTIFSAFYFCYSSSNLNLIFKNLFNLPNFEAEGSFILLTEYSHHIGQILSLILGLGFIFVLANCFINQKVFEKKYLIPLCVLGFLSASSSMFVSVTSSIVCILMSLYFLVLIFLVNKNSLSDFIKSDKTAFLPVVCFFLGFILFAFYPGFSGISVSTSVLTSAKAVIKTLLTTVPLEIATILILSVVLYFMALYKTTFIKRSIYLSFGVLAGIFTYLFMFSSEGGKMAISLADSFVLIRLSLLSVIFLLLGACIKELETEPKVRKILVTGFILIYGLFSVIQIPFVFTTMNLWRTINQESKVTSYCIEKMYRFYSLLGKTALLPEDALLRIIKINGFINDKFVTDLEITPSTTFKYTDFTTGYYETFYKNPRIVAYRFIPAKYAIQVFIAAGGEITKEEFEKPDFQKLYNDKFVINNALKKRILDAK